MSELKIISSIKLNIDPKKGFTEEKRGKKMEMGYECIDDDLSQISRAATALERLIEIKWRLASKDDFMWGESDQENLRIRKKLNNSVDLAVIQVAEYLN